MNNGHIQSNGIGTKGRYQDPQDESYVPADMQRFVG